MEASKEVLMFPMLLLLTSLSAQAAPIMPLDGITAPTSHAENPLSVNLFLGGMTGMSTSHLEPSTKVAGLSVQGQVFERVTLVASGSYNQAFDEPGWMASGGGDVRLLANDRGRLSLFAAGSTGQREPDYADINATYFDDSHDQYRYYQTGLAFERIGDKWRFDLAVPLLMYLEGTEWSSPDSAATTPTYDENVINDQVSSWASRIGYLGIFMTTVGVTYQPLPTLRVRLGTRAPTLGFSMLTPSLEVAYDINQVSLGLGAMAGTVNGVVGSCGVSF